MLVLVLVLVLLLLLLLFMLVLSPPSDGDEAPASELERSAALSTLAEADSSLLAPVLGVELPGIADKGSGGAFLLPPVIILIVKQQLLGDSAVDSENAECLARLLGHLGDLDIK